jgi:hypothetical protein
VKRRLRRWSARELAVVDRYARRVAADRSLSALEVARDCTRELARLSPGPTGRRKYRTVYSLLCTRLRAAGRGRQQCRDRWTRRELAIKERYAREVVTGRYRSALQAAPLCLRDLTALPLGRERHVTRSLVGVYARLQARVFELGSSSARAPWSRPEQATVERFAAAVISGRYRTIRSAAPDCRRELRRHRRRVGPGRGVPAPERTERSVWLRMQEAVRRQCPDRPAASQRNWTTRELAVVDRYARRVAAGLYRTFAAAAVDCRLEVAAAAPPGHVRRSAESVRGQLVQRARALHLPPPGSAWSAAEERIVDRHARMVADGRVRDALTAAELCAAAVNRHRCRYPSRYRTSYLRKPSTVHSRLLPRIAALRYPRPRTRWTEPELTVIDRFARAAIAHEYPDLLAAARVCNAELARLYVPAPRSGGTARTPTSVRTVNSVRDKLALRTRELDWRRLPCREWEPQERAVSARWVGRYARHKDGKAVAGVTTLARMMAAELDRLGFYRSIHACQAELIAGIQRGTARRQTGQRPASKRYR